MIRFDNVSLRDARGVILSGVNLVIEPSESVCITGPSGCGKSLILGMLRGEVQPTSGRVTVDNVNLAKLTPPLLQVYRRSVGVMLQEKQLLHDRSVASNIALLLEMHHAPMEELAKRTAQLLTRIHLSEKAAMLPSALHHGERKRVALAQALAHSPKILLVDEPVADVDPESRECILSLLRETIANGTTVVITASNPKRLEDLPYRMIRLKEGKVQRNEARPPQSTISPVLG